MFKRRISPFSPVAAFGRPLWARPARAVRYLSLPSIARGAETAARRPFGCALRAPFCCLRACSDPRRRQTRSGLAALLTVDRDVAQLLAREQLERRVCRRRAVAGADALAAGRPEDAAARARRLAQPHDGRRRAVPEELAARERRQPQRLEIAVTYICRRARAHERERERDKRARERERERERREREPPAG